MSKPRKLPGQSVAQRLFKRAGRRMHVGPKPAFYQRLGVADPMAADPGLVQAAQTEMFSFLSAAAYYDEVARARGRRRLLSRVARREQPRAGRRVLRSGPEALQPRVSTLAALTVAPDAIPLTAPQEAAATAPQDEAVRPRRIARDEAAGRPMARLLRRVDERDSDLSRALAQELTTARGADRVALSRVLERVREVPAAEQSRVAKAALKRERPRRLGTRMAAAQAIEQADSSPMAVATGRMASEQGPSRGLRRVLGASPAILTLEQPPAQRAEPPRQARARGVTQLPAAQSAPSREIPVAAPVREARSQQVSGRAGPSFAGVRAEQSAAWSQPQRRPTEWVASLAAAADHAQSATTEGGYGLQTGGFRPARRVGTERVAARAETGRAVVASGPVLSRASTGWLSDVLAPSRPGRAVDAGTFTRSAQPWQSRPTRVSAPSMIMPERPQVEMGDTPIGEGPGRSERQPAAVREARGPRVAGPARGPSSARRLPATVRAAARMQGAGAPSEHRVAAVGLSRSPVARVAEDLLRRSREAGAPADLIRPLKDVVASVNEDRSLSASPLAPLAAAERRLRRGEPLDWTPSRGLVLPTDALQTIARAEPAPVAAPSERATATGHAAEAASTTPARAVSAPRVGAPRAEARASQARALWAHREPASRHAAERGLAVERRELAARGAMRPTPALQGSTPMTELPATVRLGRRDQLPAGDTLSRSPVGHLRSPDAPEVAYLQSAPVVDDKVGASRDRKVSATKHLAERAQPAAQADSRGAALLSRAPMAPVATEAQKPTREGATVRASGRGDAPIRRVEGRTLLSPDATQYLKPEAQEARRGEPGVAAPPSRLASLAQVREDRGDAERPATEGASERAARRLEMGIAEPGARSPLAAAPTAYLAPIQDPGVPAQATTSDRASQRAAVRADRFARVDERGRSQLSESPTAYLRLGAPDAHPSERAATRRRSAAAAGLPMEWVAAPQAEPSRAERQDVLREARARLRTGSTGRWLDRGGEARPLTPMSAREVQSGSTTRLLQRTDGASAGIVPRAAAPRDLRYLLSDRGTALGDEPVVAPRRRRVQASTVVGRRRAAARAAEVAGQGQVAGPDQIRAAGVGTFDRSVVERVLGQVETLVRAAERADQSAVTSAVARRALGEAPDASVSVRFEDAPRARRAQPPIVPVAWAERRAERASTRGAASRRPASRRPELRQTDDETFEQGPIDRATRRSSLADTWGWMTGLSPEPLGTVGLGATDEAVPAGGRDTQPTSGPGRRRRRPTWDAQARFVRPERGAMVPPTEVGARSRLDEPSLLGEQVPSWARRAGVDPAAQPEVGPRGRSLLGALSQAKRPDDLIEVILARGAGLTGEARELPGATARLIERIASAAEAADELGMRKGARGSTTTSRRNRVVRRDVLRTVRTHHTPSGQTGTSAGRAGVGASNIMKLADKLMGLIHLAEVERRVQEAQKHVRMAADTAEARAEGGAGSAGSEAGSDDETNIKALQQEVLESVLRDLELIQQRREDPDGRSIWW